MSDLSDHIAAVVALLEASPYLTVYDGPPEPGTVRQPPYVVVYAYIPSEVRSKMNGSTDDTHVVAVTHSVGANLDAVGIIRRNVRGQLLDAAPVVAGTKCTRMEHSGRPADWDQSTGVTVAAGVDEWSYRAQPA